MPKYHYRCKIDKIKDLEHKQSKEELMFYIHDIDNPEESDLIWVVTHSIHETPDVLCPVCGEKASRTFLGLTPPDHIFKGNCYLDKSGCQRDMNLYKLANDDPYGYMRTDAEKNDLMDKLRLAGKKGFDNSGNRTTQYFQM